MDFEKLYKKFRDGDTLTNQELKYMYFKARKLREVLSNTGDVFYTALKEVNQIYTNTDSYLRARGVEIDA